MTTGPEKATEGRSGKEGELRSDALTKDSWNRILKRNKRRSVWKAKVIDTRKCEASTNNSRRWRRGRSLHKRDIRRELRFHRLKTSRMRERKKEPKSPSENECQFTSSFCHSQLQVLGLAQVRPRGCSTARILCPRQTQAPEWALARPRERDIGVLLRQ
jgi:hypothetical protein